MKRKIINRLFLIAGIMCIIYYIFCGIGTTFGQSMLWVWPAAGAVLLARYGLVEISIRRGVPLPYPKWFLFVLKFMFGFAIALFVIVECFVATGFREDCPAGVDYVILLGAKTGSVTIEARLDRAYEYLAENPETMVVVTGGQGSDEEMSEGAYMRLGLMKRGIDDSRIIVEDRSTSTAENIEFSRAMISDGNASIAIVSNNYHVFRAMGIARMYFSGDIYGLPMASNIISLPHYMVREFFTVVVDSLRGNIDF
ncbi:MAG: YdcF family protein [Clostridia bacterium]|nr:YdcF family protein [Clostridia bacterium]